MEPARAVAPRILVAVVRNGAIEGDFADVTDVNLAGDVEEFVERVRGWSISLAGIELRHMTVFRPWGSAPKKAEWNARLAEDDRPRQPLPASRWRHGERLFPRAHLDAPRGSR
jgi:hypothetical protein